MISINATLVVQVIHLLILTFILNRLMFRPILKLVDERTQYVKDTNDEIKNLRLEIERLGNEHQVKENAARKDATEERSKLRSAGIAEAEEFFSGSRKQVASIKAKANKEAEKEMKKEQPLLHGEAAVLADQIAEMIIGRRITG